MSEHRVNTRLIEETQRTVPCACNYVDVNYAGRVVSYLASVALKIRRGVTMILYIPVSCIYLVWIIWHVKELRKIRENPRIYDKISGYEEYQRSEWY